MEILRIKNTDSTNDYVKKFIKKKRDIAVIAQTQSRGRGTNGRSFSSEEGGVYLSTLKFLSIPAEDAFSIVESVSVAVVKTLLAFGVRAEIKWPNDVLVGGRKICGILTENAVENGKIVYSVVGIGLNVNNRLPAELQNIAVNMRELVGEQNLESVIATLVFNLSSTAPAAEIYRKYSCVIGRTVVISEGGSTYEAKVEDILPDGRLKTADGKTLASAEIKLKI